MIDKFTKLIEDAGGYVNPDLKLLVGDEAEHGKMSLKGVPSDVLSAQIPLSLGETWKKIGIWFEFLSDLGYDFSPKMYDAHCFRGLLMPLIGAANHNRYGGSLIFSKENIELYGVDFCYSKNKNILKQVYGIYK